MDRNNRKAIITFSSHVSEMSCAGHPGNDDNLVDVSNRKSVPPWVNHRHYCPNTDPVQAIRHVKALLSKHSQPVTWIINDNEYTNNNGTLPYLKKYQEDGDSIYVTFEITQRPSPVNRKNTEEVLRYHHEKCSEVGLRIDGVWSIKFWQSDIYALLKLSKEFEWAKNLAGACFYQGGHVDDSGWKGCPLGPYYPALNNIKGCQTPPVKYDVVMTHWLSRDFSACLQLDKMEAWGLDPADPARPRIGGFYSEQEAGDYLASVAIQFVDNTPTNLPNIVRIHEETRCYFDEGHNKDIIIDKIYDALNNRKDEIIKLPLNEATKIFREENPEGSNSYLYSGVTLDKRFPQDKAMLYEDGRCQIHYKKSIGNYMYRMYDYTRQANDSNSADYPFKVFPYIPYKITNIDGGIELQFRIDQNLAKGIYSFAIWERPDLNRAESTLMFKHIKSHDGNHVVLFQMTEGEHTIRLFV